ncbi:hypothetical protein LINPERPRIM_LOCUS20218 [Linum perenne]
MTSRPAATRRSGDMQRKFGEKRRRGKGFGDDSAARGDPTARGGGEKDSGGGGGTITAATASRRHGGGAAARRIWTAVEPTRPRRLDADVVVAAPAGGAQK